MLEWLSVLFLLQDVSQEKTAKPRPKKADKLPPPPEMKIEANEYGGVDMTVE